MALSIRSLRDGTVSLLALVLIPTAASALGTVISFGRQAALPDTENFSATAVTVSDAVDLNSGALAFNRITLEGFTQDLDALHFRPNGNALFSVDTFIFGLPDVGNVNPGDVVEWDGSNYSLAFNSNNFVGAGNVDAVSVLGNGNLLLSTKGNGNLPGIGAFLDGDVVEWNGASGSLFLAESSIFASGANNGVDALHFQDGSLIFSVRTDGIGTLGSNALAYSADSSDLFERALASGVTSLFLDGQNLWDSNNTRQTDAVFVPEPTTGLLLVLGLTALAAARRR